MPDSGALHFNFARWRVFNERAEQLLIFRSFWVSSDRANRTQAKRLAIILLRAAEKKGINFGDGQFPQGLKDSFLAADSHTLQQEEAMIDAQAAAMDQGVRIKNHIVGELGLCCGVGGARGAALWQGWYMSSVCGGSIWLSHTTITH